MRHLKSFSLMGVVSLVFAFVLLAMSADAAVLKRPLTVKSYADMYYLEWVGTAFDVVTADELNLMADTATANVYGFDPMYFRMDNNRSATTGPWKPYPGIHWPEKACVYVTALGDADGTVSDVYLVQAATKNGTFIKTGGTAGTSTVTSATATTELTAVPMVPTLFSKIVIDPTSATDVLTVSAVRIMACDD